MTTEYERIVMRSRIDGKCKAFDETYKDCRFSGEPCENPKNTKCEAYT